jgi:hypothetical protein
MRGPDVPQKGEGLNDIQDHIMVFDTINNYG